MRTRQNYLCCYYAACMAVFLTITTVARGEGEIEDRNHPTVRRAFYEPVRDARLATVRVLVNNSQVALGTVIDTSGLIVTKASELKGNTVTCELVGGRKVKATMVGADKEHDLALLVCDIKKSDKKRLAPVQWSRSDPPPVGSWLATTGLGEFPLAIGVVSVAPRKIQHRPGFLGVGLDQTDKGPRINEVLKNSAAAEAGLKVTDIVTHINGTAVRTRQAMVELIRRMRPGDRVRLNVNREDKKVEVTAVLGTPDLSGSRANRFARMNALGGKLSSRRAGFPSALQHDTVLKPNQCGGPIVDVDGNVVGVNIARAGRTHSYAIPADVVIKLVDQLKKEEPAIHTSR